MRRLGIIAVLSAFLLVITVAVAVAATTIDPAAAPQGTHLQTGTIGCTPSTTAPLLVECSQFELAGVGNANATGSPVATYTATVDCTNHGGKLVPVKSSVQTAPTTTGNLAPENGRLLVTALNSGPVPTEADFVANATCPNGNWTKSLAADSITLESFTYTLTFAGFDRPYITITGP